MLKAFKRSAWLALCVGLVSVGIFAPGASANTLRASKTATGHWEQTFRWTIDKSVSPDAHNLQTGQSGTSTYTVAVEKILVSESVWVDGEICVTNRGATATSNLAIQDRIRALNATGGVIYTGPLVNVGVSGNPVLDPGESHCYAYSLPFTPVSGAASYQNRAFITSTSVNASTSFVPFTLPASPTVTLGSINVNDTNGMSWPFSSSGSQTYTKTFTCDGDEGEHNNTATIVETGQSDSAKVTVTCTPPPPSVCTYTKGWYRNNGADTVIAVDGRTMAEAQAIFAATPGDPGGVTFGGDNTLLNLYQQLLAALNNLGGDANEDAGPAAVDAAIDAAQAGTGGSGLSITTTLTQEQMSDLIDVLSAFNEGQFAGFPHCTDEVLS